MYHKYYKEYKAQYKMLKYGGQQNVDHNYNKRIELFELLNSRVKNINDCIEDSNEPLAKGGNSNIFKKMITINDSNIFISLKEQIVDNISRNRIWNEYIILKQCTDLVLKSATQNLPMIYDMLTCGENIIVEKDLCEQCDNNNIMELCQDQQKVIFYNELADGNFCDWCYESHDETEFMSFLFQFWVGVYSLQKMGVVHNDLRLGNVLYHKVSGKGQFWKYTIDGEDYYIPNAGYVFVIWDFGSVNIVDLNKKDDINSVKLRLNIDLHFFHDLYNRLRVLLLMEKYDEEELKSFFVSKKDFEYIKYKKKECERRFRKSGRCDEKFKIALVYYLIEHNRFEELNKKSVNETNNNKIIKLPPDNINKILKELSDGNYDYDDVLKIIRNPFYKINKKINSPKDLIRKYFREYSKVRDYVNHFVVS